MSPIQLQAYSAQMHVEDYEVLEKISCSERTVVCRVVCKRGRLRGREVALKKSPFIPSPTNGSTNIPVATVIHQSLHHPNIVSLYSAFLDHCSLCLVLELCPSGNLLDHLTSRKPPTFSERELRCILKGLVDALIYLRKELVLHRKIDLSHILLTENYKVKLSGFDYAVRMSSQDSKIIPCTEISGLQKFIAPEILSNMSSGFAADVWSLGCVALACISSSFRTMAECVDPFSMALGDISKEFSIEASGFIGGLLQMDPENRTHVFYMPSHPFFHTDTELSTPLQSPLIEQQPQLLINKPRISRCLSSGAQFPRKRSTLADVGNFGLKNMLTSPSRRIVSDPIPRKPLPFLARSTDFPRRANVISEVAKNDPSSAESDRTSIATALDDYDLDNDLPDQAKIFDEPSHKRTHIPPTPFQHDEEYECKEPKLEVNQIVDSVPIGTTRPPPLNTFLLDPKTHKSSYGHITVLPSYSLLVDFRESQRRRKLDGTEVLVISPDGEEVYVCVPSTPTELIHSVDQDLQCSSFEHTLLLS
ncbi:kinase-like domain-containing protein [Crucibulum laeve]|uniref:Kinase-like domain-containing protein n=1 Tax=Crucibulum laeve TaxID=68775 RepID=A0A5C3M5H1_9AGAR|nr:kinase-like domain-containing protein [Crucibulum laeve]